jgi:hypothetical protein
MPGSKEILQNMDTMLTRIIRGLDIENTYLIDYERK